MARFKAFRNLSRETIKKIAPYSWLIWRTTTDQYRGTGYRAGETPPETGDLLVHSPYTDWYNLTWGLAPSQDMPKWRWMYRARPEIKRGIDVKVILAVGRGFRIECEEDEELETYANRLLDRLRVKDILQSAVSDMLVYGQAYFEKVRTTEEERQDGEIIETAPEESRVEAKVTEKWSSFDLDVDDLGEATARLRRWISDIGKVDSWVANKENQKALLLKMGEQSSTHRAWLRDATKRRYKFVAQMQRQDRTPISGGVRDEAFEPLSGDLVGLKSLDPLWMRINRDAFGNVLGFVQWGLTPIPQSVIPEKVVFLRWMPKSWAYENAYGTSILMPVQRHVSLLIQAEEDMKIYWHQYAKPMLVVKGGTPEHPYTDPQLRGLRNSFAARQPNTDAVVPGNVDVATIQAATGQTTSTFDSWAHYLREKIYEAIGIPSILMNLPQGTTRAVSDTEFQGFIAEEKMLQDFVAEEFMKQLIEPELRRIFPKYASAPLPVLKVVWPPVLEEDANKKIDRLIKAVGKPFVSVNEARLEIGLKPLEDEYDKLAEVSQPGFGQFSKGPEMSEAERTGPREEQLRERDRDILSR